MTTESPGSLNESPSGQRPSPAGARGEHTPARMNAERALHLVLQELSPAHPDQRIRVIPEQQRDERQAADFLIQVDDYDIRLRMIDMRDDRPALTLDQLAELAKQLEANPNTVALVVTWISPQMLAIALSLHRISYLRRNPSRLSDLRGQVTTISQVLDAILARQLKTWKSDFGLDREGPQSPADLRQVFRQELEQAIEIERRRSYRSEERKEAAQQFALQRETATVLSALDSALKGARAAEIASRLARTVRRGVA